MLQLHNTSQAKQKKIKLRDGSNVVIRQISPDDIGRLRDFFARLSPETIQSRFLGYKSSFSEAEEKRYCSIEAGIRMAIVAELEENGESVIIGLAEYETIKPYMAELGIVVEDRFQGMGLGIHILKILAKLAVIDGINIFMAVVHPLNYRMMKFVRNINLPIKKSLTNGVWEIQVKLD